MAKKTKTLKTQYDDILAKYHNVNLAQCSVLGFKFPEHRATLFAYDTLTEHLRGYIYDQTDDRVIIVMPKNSDLIPRIKEIANQHGGQYYLPNLNL